MDTTIDELRGMFRDPDQYSFHLAPVIIQPLNARETTRGWEDCQRVHEKNTLIRTGSEFRSTARFARFDHVFREHPAVLTGSVLDVGGGLGVMRQWWNGKGTYIVHDPGLRLIVSPPSEKGRALYRDGLSRSATFVIDFGEELPYRPDLFDVAIIKETLDHCIDPQQLLHGVRGVLRGDGRLVVINHFGSPRKRRRVRKHPLKLLKSLIHPDHHLRHFTPSSLRELAQSCGYVVEKDMVLQATDLLPNHYVGFWRPAAAT